VNIHAGFRQPIHLSADGVELPVSGEDCRAGVGPGFSPAWHRAGKNRGQPTHNELMRILPQRDLAIGIVEQPSKSAAHRVGHLGRPAPLAIDERRGVEPRLLLRLESNVRPGLVRMTGQQKPLGDAEPRIVLCEVHFRLQISDFRLILGFSFMIQELKKWILKSEI
jgi:hypothetical protein